MGTKWKRWARWTALAVALLATTAGISAFMPARAAASLEQQQAADVLRGRVHDATALVRTMKHDHKLARLLGKAKGVLLIPNYGRGGIVLGGSGGAAMLLVRRNGEWYGPVFYQLGGMNIGIQLGAATGPMALLLMNEKTVAEIEKHRSRWSLDAAAGIKLVKYGGESENAAGASSKGDVVLWSKLRGFYGGVALGARDLSLDPDANRTYYRRDLGPRQILAGRMRLSHSRALHVALAGSATPPEERPPGKEVPNPPPGKAPAGLVGKPPAGAPTKAPAGAASKPPG